MVNIIINKIECGENTCIDSAQFLKKIKPEIVLFEIVLSFWNTFSAIIL
jgi:hypothetical protein